MEWSKEEHMHLWLANFSCKNQRQNKYRLWFLQGTVENLDPQIFYSYIWKYQKFIWQIHYAGQSKYGFRIHNRSFFHFLMDTSCFPDQGSVLAPQMESVAIRSFCHRQELRRLWRFSDFGRKEVRSGIHYIRQGILPLRQTKTRVAVWLLHGKNLLL